MLKKFIITLLVKVFIVATLVIIAGTVFTNILVKHAIKEVMDEGSFKSKAVMNYLDGVFVDIEHIVSLLSKNSIINDAIVSRDKDAIDKANNVLDRYCSVLQGSVCYLLDTEGTVIATSNRNEEDSFLNKNYSFRPYFINSIKGEKYTYFAYGITSKKRGVYKSSPVTNDNKVIGVVVIKKDLEVLSDHLRQYSNLFFTDKNGIVFMSSPPKYVLRSLWPINKELKKEIIESKQFGEGPFKSIFPERLQNRQRVIFEGDEKIVSFFPFRSNGWNIIFLHSLKPIIVYKIVGIMSILVVGAILLFSIIFISFSNRRSQKLRQLSTGVEQSANTIAITDLDGNLTYVNKAFENITGYTKEEALGQNPRILKSGYQPDMVYKELWATISNGYAWRGEFCNKRKDGSLYWENALITPIKDGKGKVVEYMAIKEDITERKTAEEALKKAQQELERKAWRLEKTNEEIKALYKDLEKKNIELQKLDQLKSDFVSTVSHELRTPLAISAEAINLILDGIVGSITEKQTQLLKTSRDNLTRLNLIINDLLDISKIESGKITLNRGLVNITEMLKSFAESYSQVLKTKKQEISVNLPDHDIVSYIDNDKILQVVTNLLNNAHKFTPEGGRISLTLEEKGDDILLSVEDNGVGVDKEDIPKLFDKFTQFKRTAGPGSKGTGLGLAICKSLVLLHGGQIWVESEEGKGTKISFSLPNYEQVKKQYNDDIKILLKKSTDAKQKVAFIVMKVLFAEHIKNSGQEAVINNINKILDLLSRIASRSEDRIMLYSYDTIYINLPDTDHKGGVSVISRIQDALAKAPFMRENSDKMEITYKLSVYPDNGEDYSALLNNAEGIQDIS